jgi:hypothetical protein
MADKLPAGPYKVLQAGDGTQIPWYIMPFDKNGRIQAPLTRQYLVQSVSAGDFTDIILFSHGWNNDWKAASSLYEEFIRGYQAMRESRHLAYARPFRPLLIGIFWPSAALVMPWEAGPQFAGAGDDQDKQVELERQEVASIAEELDPARVERFYALVQQDSLSEVEARELAEMMGPIYATEADELVGPQPPPPPEEILAAWQRAAQLQNPGDTSGEFGEPAAAGGLDPAAAGLLDLLDPRNVVRVATVWQMKDRAGAVGAKGVGPLLQDLLSATDSGTRVHLIGHSYGCKVVLSALCYPSALPRKVNSVLLFQPAISCLCFAEKATADGRAGGYRTALQCVEQPILTTFTRHDAPLRHFFHLAVRRKEDLGEEQIAGAPPSRYAALGGYGPAGAEQDTLEIEMPAAGASYSLGPPQRRIVALKADAIIKGHSDISKEATWWALYYQLSAGGA